MDNGLIAKRYAKALYKLAKEHGKAGQLYEEMKTVARSFADNPALQRTLSNPYIPAADKQKLMQEAAGSKCDDDFKSFIKLIIEHNREEYAQRMVLAYCDLYREENNISRVRILTAKALPENRMDRIREMVKTSFPNRTFEFSEDVDPTLIGGFQVYVDNVKMDASINNELQQLRNNLISSE